MNSAAPALATEATLDAAGEYISYVYQAREAMVISHVAWRTGAVAGSPTADTRIETVDTAGIPTGTLWATNTNLVSGTLSATTTSLYALTASATIAKSDFFAVKIVYASGTSLIVQRVSGVNKSIANVPYKVTNTSGSAVKSAVADAGIIMALGSNSTTFYSVEKAVPVTAAAGTAFNNSTAGDKRGLRFQVAFDCRCAGLSFYASTSVGDFNATLYNDAGTELSSSLTLFEGDRSANSAGSPMYCVFDNPVLLSRGTWYRVTVEPTSATNVTHGILTLPSSDYRGSYPMGLNSNYTTFTTAGGWIDTATNQLPIMDILIDQIDNGAGAGASGMLFIPNMDGT
jgi:hypothetical protein